MNIRKRKPYVRPAAMTEREAAIKHIAAQRRLMTTAVPEWRDDPSYFWAERTSHYEAMVEVVEQEIEADNVHKAR